MLGVSFKAWGHPQSFQDARFYPTSTDHHYLLTTAVAAGNNNNRQHFRISGTHSNTLPCWIPRIPVYEPRFTHVKNEGNK